MEYGYNMKLMFMGTGSIASSDNPASYLIDNEILIDVPNGIVKILKRNADIRKIKAVLITHTHADHFYDLPFLIYEKIKDNDDLTIYITKFNYRRLKRLMKLGFPFYYYKMITYKKIKYVFTKKFKVNKYKIERMKVKHGFMPSCCGYIFKWRKHNVVFTGDCKYDKTITKAYSKCQYFICDATRTKGSINHMGVDNIKTLLQQKNKGIIIPSHLSSNIRPQLLQIESSKIKLVQDFEEIDL